MSAIGGRRRPIDMPGHGGFGSALRAEWVKFRTVRGWVIGLLAAALLCLLFTFLVANGSHEGICTSPTSCTAGHPFVPNGPNGEAVADTYQFVDQPLAGDGTLTVRVRSLTGLIATTPSNAAPSLAQTEPGLAGWAKAGILIASSTKQGSPYAAVMVTGRHGVRFQYDYTHDQPGLPGPFTSSPPRWLRLTRAGNRITGYDSVNGTTWARIGTAQPASLPSTVRIGLFVTSPVSFDGSATQATGTFDQVTLARQGDATRAWQSQSVGTGSRDFYTTLGAGGYRRAGGAFVLTGSGDIAPAIAVVGGDTASDTLHFGLIVALIVVIVVASMFIAGEYRRGLIRTTFTATPNRGRVLAAKALVIGAAALITGAVAAAIAIPLGEHLLGSNGDYVFPASALTVAQIIVGCGALLAIPAIAVLAVGAIARRSAAAVSGGIVVFVLPYIVGSVASDSVGEWLFRLTPAAGFSVLGILPRAAFVSHPYTMGNGYYPLSPLAGLAVLSAYAVIGMVLATVVLRRRDA